MFAQVIIQGWFGDERELLEKERPLGDGLRVGGLAPGTGFRGKL